MTLETEIERKLHTGVVRTGALCLKFVSPGFSGVPDRIILLRGGKLVFVELKKPGEKESVRQRYVQGLFRGLGFEVFSGVDSIEKIEAIIRRCREVQNEAL